MEIIQVMRDEDYRLGDSSNRSLVCLLFAKLNVSMVLSKTESPTIWFNSKYATTNDTLVIDHSNPQTEVCRVMLKPL